MSVRILAIDPGVTCGYAYIDAPQPSPVGVRADPTQAGIWTLQQARYEGYGMRFVRLHKLMAEVNPDMIAYEQVNFPHKSTAAAEAYYGIIGKIKEFGEVTGAVYFGISTTELKKRAVNKGGGKAASKPFIVRAANSFFNIEPPLSDSASASNKDHNTADAMWLLQIAIEEYADSGSKRKGVK